MNLTPIQSNSPTPPEPERNRVSRRPAERSASTRESEAAKARGLVAEISQRLKALRAEAEVRKDRVEAVLEEVRRGELLSRENLRRAAEAILQGEDPESILPG